MTHYERRKQAAFDGPPVAKKPPHLCIHGRCEFPKFTGDYCLGHRDTYIRPTLRSRWPIETTLDDLKTAMKPSP